MRSFHSSIQFSFNKIVTSSLVSLVATISLVLYYDIVNVDSVFEWPATLSRSRSTEPITYLPYTFGYAALLQTLHAYDYAEWRDIVIVDNSWDHHAFEERHHLQKEFSSLKDVIKTPVHLRFTQLQAMMDNIARDEKSKVYLWGHTDIFLLRNGSLPFPRMLQSLERINNYNIQNSQSPIGIINYHYDLLSAVFVDYSARAPWDPAMPQYGSDCDRYHRLRLAGVTLIEDTIGTIVHMHSILSHEQKLQLWESGLSIDQQVELLGEINNSTQQYAWRNGARPNAGEDADGEEDEENDRHDGLQQHDKEAALAEDEGGRKYYQAKWGPFDCELQGRTPSFDIPRLDEFGDDE